MATVVTSFTDCRDRGHAWVLPEEYKRLNRVVTGFVGYRRERGYITRTLVCLRCDTKRLEMFTPRAERLKMRYQYADGYLVKGSGRHGRDEYRTIAVKAALKALRRAA